MEVAPRDQDTSSHAASLLSSLNLQRDGAQFCDCVVRQGQDPGRLYPAHRCVLAASSPVLASILSSAGALVELQGPCMSDQVLALLLDYIYTGALPHADSQQQYCDLLTAACHLQMDELQEALRAPYASTAARKNTYKDLTNTYSKTVNTFRKYLPSLHTFPVNSLEGEDHQYATNVDAYDATEMHLANTNSCIKEVKRETCSSSSKNSSTPKSSESRVNTGTCRQVTYQTTQDLILNIPCTAQMHRVCSLDEEVQKDQVHSAGTVSPETCQMSTEDTMSLHPLCTAGPQGEEVSKVEETQRLRLTVKGKAEGKQTDRKEEDKVHQLPLLHVSASHLKDNLSPSQSSSSSSSPRLCCGAVPVIRHSSRAAVLQLAEASTRPPHHPIAAVRSESSGSAGSTDNEHFVDSITSECKNHYGAKNQDYRNNTDPTGTQSWDYEDGSDQCATQDLCSSAGQSDILNQDYSCSNTDRDEHMGNGLSHVTHDNDPCADPIQNEKNHTKNLKGSSVPQNKHCRHFIRGFQHKTDLSYDEFSPKHQRLDCSDCHRISVAIQSKDPRAVISLPVQDSDLGSDSHCEDLCSEGETKEEVSYSNRNPTDMDRQDDHSNSHRQKTDCYSNLHKAQTSTEEAASDHSEHSLKDTDMADRRHGVDVCLSVSCMPESRLNNVCGGLSALERRTSLEHFSDAEISEPRLDFTVPVNNMSDPTYGVVEQSYHGHLHYHCLPEEDTRFSHGDSDHKHTHPSNPAHLDQSSDEEEVGTFATPLRQHFAAGTADQVLLLDISAKPPELLVSFKHRSDEGETRVAFGHKDTSGHGCGKWNEATSAAGVGKRKISTGVKCGAESFDEAERKCGNVEERKSVGKDESKPGAEAIHRVGAADGENQTTTTALCATPVVPDSAQGSVSSTLSVCIPSTLSASMPTNISAHLSTPVQHPFQCSLCDRSFSQRGSLNRHVRSHLGVRPFPCPHCPMTFSRQYRVTEHMRVHQRCVLGSDFQKPPASSI